MNYGACKIVLQDTAEVVIPYLCISAEVTVDPTIAFITCTPTTCTLANSGAKLQTGECQLTLTTLV